MGDSKLLAHFTGTPTTEFSASGFEVAHGFTLDNGQWRMEQIGWYRPTVGTTAPDYLRVYRAFDQVVLTPSFTVPDDGTVGWQWYVFPSPIVLIGGTTYAVSMKCPAGVRWGSVSSANTGITDYPLLSVAPRRRVTNANTYGYPTNTSSTPIDLVDIVVSDVSVDTGDLATRADVDNALADWLSLADETHGADNIVKVALDILQAEEGIIQTVDAKVGDVQTWFQGALGIEGNFLTGALRVYLDGLKNTIDLVQAQVDLVRDTDVPTILESTSGIGSGGRPVADTAGVLDPGYVLTDTKVGMGADTWDVPADRYVWTITNPGDLTGGMNINGVPFFRHRGRWAPLEIDLVGHYYPLIGEKHLLYESGRRLPGVLLYVEPHIEWTLEAFDYVPPAP